MLLFFLDINLFIFQKFYLLFQQKNIIFVFVDNSIFIICKIDLWRLQYKYKDFFTNIWSIFLVNVEFIAKHFHLWKTFSRILRLCIECELFAFFFDVKLDFVKKIQVLNADFNVSKSDFLKKLSEILIIVHKHHDYTAVWYFRGH